MNHGMRNTLLPVLALALLSGGCARGPLSKLSGGASLRVEVEVYKGPLSQTPTVQYAELLGILDTAKTNLKGFTDRIRGYQGQTQTGSSQAEMTQLRKATESLYSSIDDLLKQAPRNDASSCATSSQPIRDSISAFALQSLNATAQPGARQDNCARKPEASSYYARVVAPASEIAARMQAYALYWSKAQVGDLFRKDRQGRKTLVDFVNLMAEYSNQIGNRASVLNRLAPSGDATAPLAGWQLPLSMHLRDGQQSDFIHLYDWFDASTDSRWTAFPHDQYPAYYPESSDYLFNRSFMKPEHRIKLASRLHNDLYWAKVNEVYTSGQGQFATAFIKDDLGNWNLKSFDNRPGELLKAQHRFTLAGIKAATQLVESGSLTSLKKATAYFREFSDNQVGAERQLADLDTRIASYRETTETALRSIIDSTEISGPLEMLASRKSERKAAEIQLATRQKAHGTKIAEIEQATQALTKSEGELANTTAELSRQQQEQKHLQEDLSQLAQAPTATSESILTKQRIDSLRNQIEKLKDSITELTQNQRRLQGEIELAKGRLNQATQGLPASLKELETARQALQKATHAEELARTEAQAAARIVEARFKDRLQLYRTLLDSLRQNPPEDG